MVPGCALAIAIGAVLNKRGYFSGWHWYDQPFDRIPPFWGPRLSSKAAPEVSFRVPQFKCGICSLHSCRKMVLNHDLLNIVVSVFHLWLLCTWCSTDSPHLTVPASKSCNHFMQTHAKAVQEVGILQSSSSGNSNLWYAIETQPY